MASVVQFLPILLFVFLYSKSEKWGLAFLTAGYFFFPFLILLLFNASSERVYLPINIMLLLGSLLGVAKRGNVRHTDLILVLYVAFFFLFIALSSLMLGQNPVSNTYFFRNFFFNLFIFSSALNLNKNDSKQLLNFLGLVICIQLLLGFLQYESTSIANFFSIETVETEGIQKRRLDYGLDGSNLVTGTLLSMANISSILTLLVLYLIVTLKRRVNFKRNLLLAVLGMAVIFFTGVRSPLAALLLILGIYFLIKKPFIAGLGIFGLVFLYGMFGEEIALLSQLASTRAFGFENPIFRMAGLLTVFEQSDSSGLLTFGRSLDLIQQYDFGTFFGNSTDLLIGDYDSPTDAFLVLLIIDYGWLTFTLLLLPYVYIIVLMRRACPKEMTMFGVLAVLLLLIETIVDEGLWYNTANFVLVLSLGLIIAINRENEYNNTGLRTGESW